MKKKKRELGELIICLKLHFSAYCRCVLLVLSQICLPSSLNRKRLLPCWSLAWSHLGLCMPIPASRTATSAMLPSKMWTLWPLTTRQSCTKSRWHFPMHGRLLTCLEGSFCFVCFGGFFKTYLSSCFSFVFLLGGCLFQVPSCNQPFW